MTEGEICGIAPNYDKGVKKKKKAAGAVIELQGKVLAFLKEADRACTVGEIARSVADESVEEAVFFLLRRLVFNGRVLREGEENWLLSGYRIVLP
ncbi:MAG: hypothetical protein KDK44_00485 [Chlamydiia bacterium]|nr:hypothetical protein [Chlamydiia bacterium]